MHNIHTKVTVWHGTVAPSCCVEIKYNSVPNVNGTACMYIMYILYIY